MRFRMMERTERRTQPGNGMTVKDFCVGAWRPVGGVREAGSFEEALREQRPLKNGRWLVLCEDDKTWRIFKVNVRQVLDLEPVDEAGDLSTALRA